jgi:thiol-disulfide isomerase/thioredoxin
MKIFDRNFFVGLAAGVALGIFIVIFGGYIMIRSLAPKPGQPPESMLQPPPFPVQAMMDYDWRVQGIDGRDFDLAETRGKVVFLNFWATWCPPCLAEMPSIQRLYDRLKNEEIVFMCVSEESESKIAEYVKQKGFTFPIYTLASQKPRVFISRGIPATFIGSPDGRIVFKHLGGAKWDDETSIEFLKSLLKSNPSGQD